MLTVVTYAQSAPTAHFEETVGFTDDGAHLALELKRVAKTGEITIDVGRVGDAVFVGWVGEDVVEGFAFEEGSCEPPRIALEDCWAMFGFDRSVLRDGERAVPDRKCHRRLEKKG